MLDEQLEPTAGSMESTFTPQTNQTSRLLATSATVNLKTVAQTLLYTVPAGKTLIDARVVLLTTEGTLVTVCPTLGVGITPAFNELYDAVAVEPSLGTAGFYRCLDSIAATPVKKTFTAAQEIKVNITTGSTATSHSGKFYLFGTLI